MQRVRAACAAALAVALVIVLNATASGSAAPAAAAPAGVAGPPFAAGAPAQPRDPVGVRLTGVRPVVSGPDEPVTITGLLDVAELGIDLTAAQPTQPPAASDDADDGAETPDPPRPPVATVEVRAADQPIRSHADVAEWSLDTAPSSGPLLVSQPVATPPDATVDQVPFSVTVPPLRASTAYGIVPVSIQVYLPGQVAPVQVVHTFLGHQRVKEYAPLALTWVVPFVLPPDVQLVGEYGQARTEAWEELLGQEGSMQERLADASRPGVAWAIEPALLLPGRTGEGAPTPNGDGDTPPPTEPGSTDQTDQEGAGQTGADPQDAEGTDQPPDRPAEEPTEERTEDPTEETTEEPTEPASAAVIREQEVRTAYASALVAAVRGRDVMLLPRHDADLAALPIATDAGNGASSLRSLLSGGLDVSAARDLLEDAGARVHEVVWPIDGTWSSVRDAALRELPGSEAWGVLASAADIVDAPDGPVHGPSGAALWPVDDSLSAAATAAVGSSAPVPAALRLMADTLVTLNQLPGTPRHRFVLVDRAATLESNLGAVSDVLDAVPWVGQGAVPDVEGSGELVIGTSEAQAPRAGADADPDAAGPAHAGTPAPPGDRPPALTPARAGALARTQQLLPIAASVRADTGADLAGRGADTLAQLTSARWRAAPQRWAEAYDPVGEQVSATFTALTIPSRDISFLADSGVLRVAVENRLDDGIRNATLELRVAHPILRVESGPQPVEVGADSRTTVGFDATAIASGRVLVTAVVRAPDGTALGDPSTFTVRVSPTAEWIYWVLGALAVLVIFVGVARTVLRRGRAATSSAPT